MENIAWERNPIDDCETIASEAAYTSSAPHRWRRGAHCEEDDYEYDWLQHSLID